MNSEVSEQIGRLNERIAIYTARNARDARAGYSGNLWADEIRDCQIMIERLQNGEPLTRSQLGLPTV